MFCSFFHSFSSFCFFNFRTAKKFFFSLLLLISGLLLLLTEAFPFAESVLDFVHDLNMFLASFDFLLWLRSGETSLLYLFFNSTEVPLLSTLTSRSFFLSSSACNLRANISSSLRSCCLFSCFCSFCAEIGSTFFKFLLLFSFFLLCSSSWSFLASSSSFFCRSNLSNKSLVSSSCFRKASVASISFLRSLSYFSFISEICANNSPFLGGTRRRFLCSSSSSSSYSIDCSPFGYRLCISASSFLSIRFSTPPPRLMLPTSLRRQVTHTLP
mmetsp:Transcript_3079/g.3892  ORF Transcript_3079/g.3892 Transcript_3079/m.3892 type:complete len:270 (+) Transcript_3079:2525-3334(+)